MCRTDVTDIDMSQCLGVRGYITCPFQLTIHNVWVSDNKHYLGYPMAVSKPGQTFMEMG